MFIDITKDLCPITFVKTKLALETLPDNEDLIVKLKEGEPLENVPPSVIDLGYKIKNIKSAGNGFFLITISKDFK
tara:strand:- start:83 stop:307 length:225 start_codon:yes stop_codon:yes gene_type:complete